MDACRWGGGGGNNIDKAGGVSSIQYRGEDVHGGSRMTAGMILFPAS